MASRIAAITGAASSVDSDDSTVAPRNAPTAPGTPSFATSAQSMFLNFQCDSPDAKVVPTSARCTAALAWADADAAEHQQRRGGDAEGHAERAVDELGADADEGEDDERTHGSDCFRSMAARHGRRMVVGADQTRAQHHSSKAMKRRDGQNGSSANADEGAVRKARSAIVHSPRQSCSSQHTHTSLRQRF